MYKTLNIIDTSELKKNLRNLSLKDSIADKLLIKLDILIDSISDIRKEIDQYVLDFHEEGASDLECLALEQTLTKLVQRTINHWRERKIDNF